jgi:hypothetical protein
MKKLTKTEEDLLEVKDKRVKVINEILQGIRILIFKRN